MFIYLNPLYLNHKLIKEKKESYETKSCCCVFLSSVMLSVQYFVSIFCDILTNRLVSLADISAHEKLKAQQAIPPNNPPCSE